MVKRVVAVAIALYGGRMCPPRVMYHRAYFERWSQHAIRVAYDYLTRDNLFGHQDHIPGCQHGLLAYARVAPEVCVAFLIAALQVYDGHVGPECRYQQEGRAI